MSKLIDSIDAICTGRRYRKGTPIPLEYLDVQAGWEPSVVGITDEYWLRVQLGVNVRVDCQADYRGAKFRAQEFLTQLVFGEFREDLEECRLAIFSCDQDGAMKALNRIQDRMFRNE